MAIPRFITAPIGRAAQIVGRTYDYATPGAGTSTLTNVGRSITDLNQVYTGGGKDGQASWAQVDRNSNGSTSGYETAPVDNTPINQGGGSNNTGYWVGGRNYGSANNFAQIQQTNAMLDDQSSRLNRLLGTIGTQRDQGLQKLSNSYNTEKLAGEQQYDQQAQDNTRQKMTALNKVDTNARTAYNSLRRLLGLSGSANQSALKFAAPNAIAKVASGERANQIENFGLNERNITNARKNFLDDLLAKKNERESAFLQGLLSQEQSIQSDLGDIAGQRAQLAGGNFQAVRNARAPFQATIDQKQSEIDNLFSKYNTPFNANRQLAQLNEFTVDKAALNANRAQGQAEFSPYQQPLRRRLEQDYM